MSLTAADSGARMDVLRREAVAALDAAADTLHVQSHPSLSPVGWHVGHMLYIEGHWLRRALLGDGADLDALDALYLPEQAPKPGRGGRLPDLAAMHQWADWMGQAATDGWQHAAARHARHGMVDGGYLRSFVTQHYAQHLELVDLCRHAGRVHAGQNWQTLDDAAPATVRWREIPGQTLTVGRLADIACPAPYDNELGEHQVCVQALRIASTPVSNADWRAFMADDGYHREALWSAAGWRWRHAHGITAPFAWRRDGATVHAVAAAGGDELAPHAPVSGISRFEALAYARWAGARLPTEHEWLAARRAGALDGVGQVWEWCANALDTWPGFVAFPYPRYTPPWCDGAHYVLKGASRFTRPDVARDSFRNFYTADARHVHAGLRLAASP